MRAGLDGYLFTLEKAARAKIAQILAYGPKVFAVAWLGYDPVVEQATWSNIRSICEANGWGMLVTARRFSPHAMEGVKTIAYEICEQLGGAPDVVYVPVGGGGLLSATWKGFVEWHAAGAVDRLPKIVAVQPEGCDGITQAWREDRCHTDRRLQRLISGLQLTAPPDGDLVLRALRKSGGWAVWVRRSHLRRAGRELAGREASLSNRPPRSRWRASAPTWPPGGCAVADARRQPADRHRLQRRQLPCSAWSRTARCNRSWPRRSWGSGDKMIR